MRKPENVSHVDAACAIGDSIKAYTALFYQAKIQSGETILIMDACSVNYYLDVFKIRFNFIDKQQSQLCFLWSLTELVYNVSSF